MIPALEVYFGGISNGYPYQNFLPGGGRRSFLIRAVYQNRSYLVNHHFPSEHFSGLTIALAGR
jgi:hypothetical protein